MTDSVADRADAFCKLFTSLESAISQVVVGQTPVIRGLLSAVFANGHVLLEGAPGLGKTLLVRSLGAAAGLDFSRIQFTPDLMPADIVGTNFIVDDQGRKVFEFQRGPVFTNILLADEINRATPKTQSALLEAMQEHHVTTGGSTHPLPSPFFVLATQNPLEMEGTYPLPEAQLDRFLVKLLLPSPDADSLHAILDLTTSGPAAPISCAVVDRGQFLEFQKFVREVPVAREVQSKLVALLLSTHPGRSESAPLATRFIRYGSSPRGAQAILLCAKIRALLEGRFHVATEDLGAVAKQALRHRLILNFEGESEGITADQVIEECMIRAFGA